MESFKEEGRRFVEIICINCARLWTPQQLVSIVRAHATCCSVESIRERAKKLRRLIAREHPSPVKDEELVPEGELVTV